MVEPPDIRNFRNKGNKIMRLLHLGNKGNKIMRLLHLATTSSYFLVVSDRCNISFKMEKKFHTHDTHWLIFVDFMEKNSDFARGKFTGIEGKKKNRMLWDDLTNQLNSAGLGVRTREKWQKAWTDLKSKVKQKAATLKFLQQGTGGGEETHKPLTDIELRILGIFGSSCFEGTDNPERGIPSSSIPREAEMVVEENNSCSSSSVQTPTTIPSSSIPREAEMVVEENNSCSSSSVQTPTTIRKRRLSVENTPFSSKKKKMEDNVSEAVCIETIGLLHEIKEELQTFNTSFTRFNNLFKLFVDSYMSGQADNKKT
ncbi:Myb/SANT-like DNA-binding domain [Popillia japonica]|uniref:Regulatory protein zeste n=1 Tax=Popillia japonica TaxID=7064 RepID=A0AAW1IRX4_POPJA